MDTKNENRTDSVEASDKVIAILDKLGLSLNDAVELFYKQIEERNGLPLKIVVSTEASEEQLFEELDIGIESLTSAKTFTINESWKRADKLLDKLIK